MEKRQEGKVIKEAISRKTTTKEKTKKSKEKIE